jgi:SAM-dependent methyltransferase
VDGALTAAMTDPKPGEPAATRERARLIALMDEYLAALSERRTGRLRLAPHLRSTEDTQVLPLGCGIWRTIRGVKGDRHYFVDVAAGQVECWDVIDEMGAEAIVSIRLKAEGTTIAEIETILTRAGAFFRPQALSDTAIDTFHRVIEPARRRGRDELIRVVNLYFDAIELSRGDIVPVNDDCRRLVNGVVDSLDDPNHLVPGEEHRALTVSEQITAGHYAYIEALRARRFPIVDEERGIAVCHLVFDHPGDLERAAGDIPIKSPNSMVFTEVFKIVDGRIEEIWALGTAPLPIGTGTGW